MIQPSGNTPRAELASEAVPLYSMPDDAVYGDRGLVRSVLLNGRLHALIVDIEGEERCGTSCEECVLADIREDVTAARAAEGTTGALKEMRWKL